MAFRGYRKRHFIVYTLAVGLFIPIYFRLFDLQVLHQDKLLDLVEKQHNLKIEIAPRRGYIYDRTHNELATSLKVPSVYAVPRLIFSKQEMAQRLAAMLELDESFVFERLSRDKAFVWLKRKVSDEEAKAILALNDTDINILYEHKRFYPHGTLLAHVLGFCNIDNEGLEGVELKVNSYLAGQPGYQYTKRDARGRKLVAMKDKYIPPVHGSNVHLTIDQFIQHIVERALDEAYQQWRAEGAIAIVMDCRDGRILGMANRPTYDLNAFATTQEAARRNRAITDFYEPGSVFKVVTATAALQEEEFTLEDTIFCENGEYRITRSRVLHDVHGYGRLEFPMVFIKSSNIGTVKIAQQLGEEKFYYYMKQFGFGELTRIDLPGEVRGVLRPPAKWSKISITSLPIGQEVATTALQMLTALSAIANGGHIITPYVIDEIRDDNGVVIQKTHPFVKRTIMDETTAATLRTILTRVVEEGTGKRARISGIPVAGKTGTAQKILTHRKGYSHSDFISSFMGFVPADDPMLSIIVVVDRPRPLYYGGTVAAPVFKAIAEKTLNYLGYIPTSEDEHDET